MTSERSQTHSIKLLPDGLINRIAAGEVVERPSAVLKELVENSLDAGAGRIDIEIHAGGKRLIRVRDNGRGMVEDDLFLCLERHATSKIAKDEDLLNISTLGFRGEALPSIASVARMTITSATDGGSGHMITISGGRLGQMEEVSANRGTTVEVTDLFYNVPARKKFLKSDITESAHLLDVAQAYALSRDGLGLTYRDNGREVLSVESRHDFKTRVYRVLGRKAAESLVAFRYREEGLTIAGWVGGPESFVRSSANIFMYVLGRPVRDRLLNRAVTGGYGRLLSPGQWPTAVVFIEIDPSEVDVNVHPAKAEVRFRRPSQIFSALSSAVSGAIGQRAVPAAELKDPVAAFDCQKAAPTPAPTLPGLEANPVPRPQDALRPDPDPLPEIIPPWMVDERTMETGAAAPMAPQTSLDIQGIPPESGTGLKTLGPLEPRPESRGETLDLKTGHSLAEFLARPASGASQIAQADLAELRPLAQLYQSYILAQGAKGLYIVDQHAAHERILYHQLKVTLDREGLPSQTLLFPDTADLPPEQALAAENLQPHLERLGFDLSLFGERTFILKSAPSILGSQDPWPPLLEILGTVRSQFKSLEGAGLVEALNNLAGSWLYSLACRAAIKAGDKMNMEAMAHLLADMAATPHGVFCPHGRPAVQLIERYTIEKKFDRR